LLQQHGINTALELRGTDLEWVRQRMTVVGLRTVLELRGQPCIPLGLEPVVSQQILRSRSFGQTITALPELEEAIATHTSRAAEKLRAQNLAANLISVFIRTNAFVPDDPQYGNSSTVRLPVASQDTTTLITCALTGLRRIYRPGYRYKKGGVMLMGLVPVDRVQGNLFVDGDTQRQTRLNQVLDQVNRRFGRFYLHHATMGIKRRWTMRRDHCSPYYTTRWSDLPVVQAQGPS
jgi:DNA polymerase V